MKMDVLLERNNMIFFTSDWHIGHDKDFLYRPRGFQNIEEMNNAIIKNCNSIVGENDILYILGDLALVPSNEYMWNQIYYNIKCKDVRFIEGNHDTDNRIDKYIEEYGFEYRGCADRLDYNHLHFYLSHYPSLTTNKDYDKPLKARLLNLSGHTHSKDIWHGRPQDMCYNVAVDAHNNYPVSIEEIIEDFKKVI